MATSASTFPLKTGDRIPAMQATLRDAAGTPVDLRSATSLIFKMRRYGTTDPTIGGTGLVAELQPGTNTPEYRGVAWYLWDTDDTLVAGTYEGEWYVAWPDGRSAHFPNAGKDVIVIELALPQPVA
jgi:hypothetical protein